MHKRNRTRSGTEVRRLVLCAVFAALAFAVMFAFRFNVGFLTFDLKDTVITVAGLLLGPMAALLISFVVAVLEFITVGDTGFYGFLMNVASSMVFSVVASVVYQYRKRLSGAIMGLACSVVAMVSCMMLLNLFVTPLYMGVSRADVAGMIPTLLLPFNAVKGFANAALVLVLYKPISRAMAAAGLLPHRSRKVHEEVPASGHSTGAQPGAQPGIRRKRLWISLAVSAAGVLVFAAAVIYFAVVLKGNFEWF